MKNNNSKSALAIAVLFELILIVTAIFNIAAKQWKDLSLTVLAIVCLVLPFIITHIANIKNLMLPSSFQIITLVFLVLAQYFGEINDFYQIFWWWDLLLHAIFGSYTVIISLQIINGILGKKEEISEQRSIITLLILAFGITIALGTLWEMFEFIGDYFFKSNMVKGGLKDTATDLLVKIMASFLTSITLYHLAQKDNRCYLKH